MLQEQLKLVDGTIVRKVPDVPKTLYCSSEGKFYSAHNAVLTDDGWQMHEIKADFPPSQANNKAGSCYPKLRTYPPRLCHVIIALAWLGPRPAGMEIDHINGDKFNWSADNLQYVTPGENRKRARLLRCLRSVGRNPKQMSREELLEIFEKYEFTNPQNNDLQ